MNYPLKEQVKKYFDAHSLSEDQIQKLLERQKKAKEEIKLKKLQVYAGLAVSVASLLVVSTYLFLNDQSELNIEHFPEEIAYHHNKQMSSEYKASSIKGLKKHLTKLDFSLADSELLPESEWEVLGARYCSLQGRLAAQIKIRNTREGEIYTLYQMDLPDNLDSKFTPFDEFHDGVRVRIWSEKGLLFGLAGGT